MLAAVDRVVNGCPVEDDYTECKATWPDDYRKSARQIAALCNAARGAEALWIIGLDERRKRVEDAGSVELANWWPQLERCFDGVAPAVQTLNVATATGDVTALLFETDRSPYVHLTGHNHPQREVPWRTATGTSSATRAQLLSLLVATAVTPQLELISPQVTCIAERVTFEADLFISAREQAMLPNHRWSLTISCDEWDSDGLEPLRPTLHVNRLGTDEDGPGLRVLDHSGIYVNGAGRVHLRAELSPQDFETVWPPEHRRTFERQAYLRIALDMPVDGRDRAAHAAATLTWVNTGTVGGLWRER